MKHADEGKRGDREFGTIPRMLALSAARHGAATAIEDGDVVLSFEELTARVRVAARALLAREVEARDRIAIWAPNMWEWVVAALAVHSVGAVVVPINTRYKGAEAATLLNESGAVALFTVTDFLATNYVALLRAAGEGLPALRAIITLRGSAEGCTSWSDFLAEADAIDEERALARAEAVEPGDLCDILFTSGTTGKPKGAMCTHAQTLRVFRDWSDVVGLRARDRYLVVLPFFHTFGYKAGWLSCLMMGATILPEPVFDVGVVLARVGEDRVTVLPGPPALFQSILAHPELESFDLSSLRLSVTGAAVIPVELIHRMRDRLCFETIITGYGLTESTGVVAMCRHDDDPETIAKTSGRAIPAVEVRVVDSQGQELPRHEAGEIVVRGYNVMKGYLDAPEETASAIDADGWLHTGDVGVMDDAGYLRITDRIKDMFIVGGFNAYPAEIETLLLRRRDLVEAAVIGVPDERLGEVGLAFVVPVAGASPTPEELIAYCRETMANFKVPRRVEVVDALPRNATGKVQKFKLRESADA